MTMARIAVVFGTIDGQTAKISRRIVDVLRTEGHVVELLDTRAAVPASALVGIQAAVIAGSVRMGKFQRPLITFVQDHLYELLVMPTAFIPVSLSASRKSPAAQREVQKTTARFIAETGLNPNIIQPTAGALVYSRYGFFTKLAILFISKISHGDTDTSRDYEYTDWRAVDAFARHFADDVQKLFGRELVRGPIVHRDPVIWA
jgi:menaquinone-dependent protoporphyrinogen oxidase